eukprot:UN04287
MVHHALHNGQNCCHVYTPPNDALDHESPWIEIQFSSVIGAATRIKSKIMRNSMT